MASAGDGPIAEYLAELDRRTRAMPGGEVATYIPELAKADPNHFGVAIAMADGRTYAAGDCDVAFTIQSVSKPFLYGFVLQELGRDRVLRHVGVEPTGQAFNSTVLDEENSRPFNPMVNAGAIAVSALVQGGDYAARRRTVVEVFSRFAGRALTIDEAVFESERETGDRNRAIAALMRQASMLEGDTEAILDLYFSQCSVLVTCRDLAVMAATLANGGVNPVTGERALAEEYVHDVLTVMNSCGMYNYAGQWSYEVGIPAKSGVAGSIAAAAPGQAGIAAFSPPLDRFGNSVRAIAACKQIAADFGLHAFRTRPGGAPAIRSEARGDAMRSKRRRTAQERDVLNAHGRRIAVLEAQGALHFGAAEMLTRRLGALLEDADFVIADMRRVFAADRAACAMLQRLAEGDARLMFAHAGPEGPLAALHAATPAARFHATRDAALE
ncbi:MAG: glutaminase A, partial [Hyphomonadaceae bacterium]